MVLLASMFLLSSLTGVAFVDKIYAAAPSDWTLIYDGRGVKAYPDLREYVWQKNATMAPNGLYDKIGLHRLVKTGTTTKGAVFLLPGLYGSGAQLISNPPESNYSIDESSRSAVYWANRGFDVYSIDYRAHFLPSTMNASQASTVAANWGWDVYISDMKEAVDKAKAVSGFAKIFMAGESFGETVTMYYASEYWQQDLKGLILLDGSENTMKSSTSTNTSNVTTSLSGLASTGGLALEYPRTSGPSTYPSGIIFAYQNAVQNPGAPAEWPPGTPLQPTTNPLTNKTWANITEWFAYRWYSSNFCNVYGGYGNVTVNIQRSAGADRYFPMRLLVENGAIHDWTNCPFVAYDFDDHYGEISVPVLGFKSTLYGIPTWGNYTNGLATTDFTQITLSDYMHLDVFTGTYSAEDVSEPTYEWMLSHLSTSSGWSKTYGGTGDENAHGEVVQTSDGGYAVSGDTSSVGAGGQDYWLFKVDAAGNMIWNKTYGGNASDTCNAMSQTNDGGYALIGVTASFGAGSNDLWLVKTDASGNMQWNKTYGGTGDDQGYWAVQTSDGGYAVAGTTNSFGAGNVDGWLIKTDSTGNMQWNKTYGAAGMDSIFEFVVTPDGGYALGGLTMSYGAGGMDYWLVKTDAAGNMQWNKTYGGTGVEIMLYLIRTADGGYAMAGPTRSFGAGGQDYWLVKTDGSGNMQWNKTYGGTGADMAWNVVQTFDGYALGGYTSSFGAGAQDFWLVKTDAAGNMQWNQTYGGAGNDVIQCLIQTSDGGYFLTGSTASFGAGGTDAWLVKTDGAGVIPESLTIGAIMLLSSIAALIGTIYFRKPPRIRK